MTQALDVTLQTLTHTNNEAAVSALLPALDSPHPAIQEGALRALLNRRSIRGGREILRRLDDMPPRWHDIIRRYHGRLVGTFRDAIVGKDADMAQRGCRAAVSFHEYDLVPTMLSVLEGRKDSSAEPVAAALLELVGALYDELANPRDYREKRDPRRVRDRLVESLGSSARRYERHKRLEVIEAFLLLVHRDDTTLRQILKETYQTAFTVTMNILANSEHGGVIRLLLSFLDDPKAPSAALSVIAKRSDRKFVEYLLRKIGYQPSAAVAKNLKRMYSIPWLCEGNRLFEQLDDAAQHGAVRLAMTSGVPRLTAFAVVRFILTEGKPGGRREAAAALVEFQGAEANDLALCALEDPDPQVQAMAAKQLRSRGIPGAMGRLLTMIDSPHAVVRKAVRESLEEFHFPQFLASFDMLDDDARRSTGLLVRRIDPQGVARLRMELESKMRTRRLRGVAMADCMELVERLEPEIVGLLQDDDHMVRAEAAGALRTTRSEASRLALEAALEDSSPKVRQTAEESLLARGQLDSTLPAVSQTGRGLP